MTSSKTWALALAIAAAGTSGAAFADASFTTSMGKTTVSGKTYVDGTWKSDRTDNGGKNAKSGYGFDVKRFYMTFDQQFNSMWSARFRTDIETGDSASHTNAYNVYVKNAYIQAHFNKAFQLRAGLADMPWIPYVEHLYGYRYVEHVLVDRAKFGNSADLGLHAMGKLDGGKVDYQLSAVNGGGYHNTARSNSIDVAGRLGFHPTDKTTIAIGGYEGKLGNKKYNTTPNAKNTAYRGDVVAAYVSKTVRFGVDGFYAKNWQTVTTNPSQKSYGASVWASYVLPTYGHRWSVFGRYDYVRPDNNVNSGEHENYANVGLQYKPIKALRVAAVYKIDRINAGNGAGPIYDGHLAKSTGTAGNNAQYDEFGVFAQYTF